MQVEDKTEWPITAHPFFKTAVLAGTILLPVAVNQVYPGEVFHHSKYLFILASFLAFLLAMLYLDQQGMRGISSSSITISLLMPLCLLPSWFGSINKARSQDVLWLFLAYLLLLLSVSWLEFDFKQIEGAVAVVCLIATIVGFIALYQYLFGLEELRKRFQDSLSLEPLFKSRVLERIQSRRVLANYPLPNTLSGFLATVLPLQLYYAITHSPSSEGNLMLGATWKNDIVTALLMCCCLLSIIGLVLTQSFGGWVAGLASVSLAGILLTISRKLRLRWVAASFVLLFVLLVVWMVWVTHERGFALGNLKAPTNPIVLRWNNYKTAWHIFEDFPWTGVGLGNYGTINPHYQGSPLTVTQYAHNTPLQLLSELGVMAFFLAAGLLILSFKTLKLLLAKVRGDLENPKNGNPSPEYGHPLMGQLQVEGRAQRGHISPRCQRLHRAQPSRNPCVTDPLRHSKFEAGNRMALSIALASSLAAWGVHNLIDINLYFPSVGSLGVLILGLLLSLLGSETIETERAVLSGWPAKTVWIIALLVCIGSSFLVGRQYLV